MYGDDRDKKPENQKNGKGILGIICGCAVLAVIGFFMSQIFFAELPSTDMIKDNQIGDAGNGTSDSPGKADDVQRDGSEEAAAPEEAERAQEEESTQEEDRTQESTDSEAESQGNESEKASAGEGKVTVITPDVSSMVKEVMPSIVSITNTETLEYFDWFGESHSYEAPSSGSGIIIRQEGDLLYIVTNYHVIASAGNSDISIGFVDDTSADAQIQGIYESKDLAVLKVSMSDLSEETQSQIKIAALGDSTTIKTGDSAVAIGNSMGYGQSVTVGVVSALNREITVEGTEYHVIQTDAAINPGNSGGALLNSSGEVIGINSVKIASYAVEGIGYAIPMEEAQPIMEELMSQDYVDADAEKGYLGIAGVDVDDAAAEKYGMPKGICIVQVYSGTAADHAGLKKGDIICSIDGKEMTSMAELKEIIEQHRPGDWVTLGMMVYKNGRYTEEIEEVLLGSKADSRQGYDQRKQEPSNDGEELY